MDFQEKKIRWHLHCILQPGTRKSEMNDYTSGGLIVSYEEENRSGEWWIGEPIEFYNVRGAKESAFYWMEVMAASSFWSTEDLLTPNGKNVPEISHFTKWNDVTENKDDEYPPVPEQIGRAHV